MNVLVLSGGGQGGWGVLGGLSEMEHISFDAYIGTSVGGVISVLLCIGFTANEVFDLLIDIEIENNLSLPMFLTNYGLSKLDCILKHIETMIKLKCEFVPTFKECKQMYDKDLIITGVCLTDRITTYFKWDTHPDMNILDALYITCAVPVLFVPIMYKGKMYVDGGVGDNFPIEYAKRMYTDKNIYGIYLKNKDFETKCVVTFVLNVMYFVLFNNERVGNCVDDNIHIIVMENNPFELANIFKNDFDRRFYFNEGKRQAINVLRL
jgi:predicted acylesterase/phospholipase RssA